MELIHNFKGVGPHIELHTHEGALIKLSTGTTDFRQLLPINATSRGWGGGGGGGGGDPFQC